MSSIEFSALGLRSLVISLDGQVATVLHVGPASPDGGGMASVIQEHINNSSGNFAEHRFDSWKPKRPFWSAASIVRLPRVLIRTRAKIVHVHLSEGGSFLREGLLLAVAKVFGRSTVVTLHGADYPAFAKAHPRVCGLVFGLCDRILVLGPKQADVTLQIRPTAAVTVVKNPAPKSVSVPASVHKDKVVLFAGEVGERKGFDLLHRAWSSVADAWPSWRLVICGPLADGAIPPVGNGMDYRGPLPRGTVMEVMSRASLVCLPSRREVLPMTVIESLSLGTPVLATRAGEIEVLAGCPSLIFSDPDKLAERLSECLARIEEDTASWETAADQGRVWMAEYFSPEVIRDLFHGVYRSLIAAHGGRHD